MIDEAVAPFADRRVADDEHAAAPHRRRRRARRIRTSPRSSSIATASRCISRARRFRTSRPVSPAAPAWRHVGLYVYRRECLLRLARLPPTALERAEALEQLRALEHGIRIKAIETALRLDRRRYARRSRARPRVCIRRDHVAERTDLDKGDVTSDARHTAQVASDPSSTSSSPAASSRRSARASPPPRSARCSRGTATRSRCRSSTPTSTSIPGR